MKTKKRLLTMGLAGVLAFAGAAWGDVVCSGTSQAIAVDSELSMEVEGQATVSLSPFVLDGGEEAKVLLDGKVLFSGTGGQTFDWQPQTLGAHELACQMGGKTVATATVNVKSLAFAVQKEPNPPTAEHPYLSITPVTQNFGVGGGEATIVVSGSGTWQASVSDPWITLNATSGRAGEPVEYVVGAATNAESRTGYVYVSGYVHTVTQDGLGATISPESATFEAAGGKGTITVTPPDRISWQARANVDWVSVSPVSGTGAGTVTFTVAPMREKVARQGTLTVGGQTFTVTQKARELVEISAVAEHGGTVEGAGSYDLGTKVTLTAVPGSGYEFSHWTGDVESMENPLVFNADVPKSFTAVFAPLPIAFESVVSGTNGVTFAWNNLAWATHYLLYRGVTSVPSSATLLADIPNTGDCTFLDDTGELEVEYWYWIEAEGVEDDVMGDPMTGKKKWGWPDAKDEAEVAAALAEAEDARLQERIGSVGEYDAFRAWSAGEGREEKDVRDSEHAWSSYALGAEGLFENEPQIQIAGFAPDEAAARRRAAGTTWKIRVTVKDGENAASVDADKLAALFEATRQIGDWTEPSLLPLSVTAKGTDGDTLLFEVTLDGEDGPGAFLRLGE